MKKKPIRALVFDLDGTLIKFQINSLKARRKAINVLINYGIPKAKLSKNISVLENIQNAKQIFNDNGLTTEEIGDILKKVNDAIIEVEYEAAIKATPIKGIEEVLKYAKKKKLILAIFTYNTNNNTKTSLQAAGIIRFFDLIVGRDDINNLKPHPDHLNYICNQLNVDFDEILVIGDTGRDIEAALNVGAHSIALNTKIPSFLKRDLFHKAEKVLEPEDIPLKLIRAIEELL